MKGINLGEFEELIYHLTIPGNAALVDAKSMRDQLWERIPSVVWQNV